MRIFPLLCSLLLGCALCSAQSADRGIAGYCPYGCGPYVPMITTPSLSFATYSQHAVGATNATGGLFAGATNSTLSEVNGNTDSVRTVPVWYAGGGMPLVSPATNSPVGSMKMNGTHREYRGSEERAEHEARREHEPVTQAWVYFASSGSDVSAMEKASSATGVKSSNRSFTNDDIEQVNQKNGYVHYDGKTEKIQ